MLSILLGVYLKTLIGQMDISVAFASIVVDTTSAYIALSIIIYSKVICYNSPHPDVELATVIQQRFFNVFLNHPRLIILA
jgi:hypothetical protein